MVLIDIPMPGNCGECRLMADGWCYALQADSHTNRYAADFEKRPEWCPIRNSEEETLSEYTSRLVNKLERDLVRYLKGEKEKRV